MYKLLRLLASIRRFFRNKNEVKIDKDLMGRLSKLCEKYKLSEATLIEALIRQYFNDRTKAFGLRNSRNMLIKKLSNIPKSFTVAKELGFEQKGILYYIMDDIDIGVNLVEGTVLFSGKTRYPIIEEINNAVTKIFVDDYGIEARPDKLEIPLDIGKTKLFTVLVKTVK